MKIALCAIVKNENIYLREWVEYHKSIGFDKIILYDNNPVDGEVPHQVIGDYVMDGYVDVYNVRGVAWSYMPFNKRIYLQSEAYKNCLETYHNEYKWIAFIDVDEFITISNNESQNIHDIFEKYKYDKAGYEQVLMSWYTIGDDGEVNYNPTEVRQRFLSHRTSGDVLDGINDFWVKSIVRSDILSKLDEKRIDMSWHATNWLYSCNEQGRPVYPANDGHLAKLPQPYHNILYVKHYFSKSLWEHLSRMRDIRDTWDQQAKDNRIHLYKKLNGWSNEHEKAYMEYIQYMNNKEVL